MPARGPTTDDQLRLGRHDDGRPTSADEFAAAEYEEPWTYERVDGRLVVMSPGGTGHVNESEPWLKAPYVHSSLNPASKAQVVAQARIHLDDDTTRIADIGVSLGGGVDIPRQVPDLVLEVVSPGKAGRRRVYVEKRAQHEMIGVREYVIIDRAARSVTVLSLGEGGTYAEAVLGPADTYGSPPLPGFAVPLAGILGR